MSTVPPMMISDKYIIQEALLGAAMLAACLIVPIAAAGGALRGYLSYKERNYTQLAHDKAAALMRGHKLLRALLIAQAVLLTLLGGFVIELGYMAQVTSCTDLNYMCLAAAN